jgi:hypothetical protein
VIATRPYPCSCQFASTRCGQAIALARSNGPMKRVISGSAWIPASSSRSSTGHSSQQQPVGLDRHPLRSDGDAARSRTVSARLCWIVVRSPAQSREVPTVALEDRPSTLPISLGSALKRERTESSDARRGRRDGRSQSPNARRTPPDGGGSDAPERASHFEARSKRAWRTVGRAATPELGFGEESE